MQCLFAGGELFLFAFHAHLFEFALFGVVGLLDFLLDLGCRFFELWGECDVAVVLHAGSGGDEAADDDVFLEAAERVDGAVDAGFGEHAGGLLEAGGRDEAVGRERGLGDAEQERATDGRATAFLERLLVFGVEAEAIGLLIDEEAVSPTSSILTQRSICRTMVSMCLSEMVTPWRR